MKVQEKAFFHFTRTLILVYLFIYLFNSINTQIQLKTNEQNPNIKKWYLRNEASSQQVL